MFTSKIIRTEKKYTVLVTENCKIENGEPVTVEVHWRRRFKQTSRFLIDYKFIDMLDNFMWVSITSSDRNVYNVAKLLNDDTPDFCVMLYKYIAWLYSQLDISYNEFIEQYNVKPVTEQDGVVTDYTSANMKSVRANTFTFTESYAILSVHYPIIDSLFHFKISLDQIEEVQKYRWAINTNNRLGHKYTKFGCYTNKTIAGKSIHSIFLTTMLFGNDSNKTRWNYELINGERWCDFQRNNIILRKLNEKVKVKKDSLPMGISIGNSKYFNKYNEEVIYSTVVATYTNSTVNKKLAKRFSINKLGYDSALKVAIAQRKEWEDMYGTK